MGWVTAVVAVALGMACFVAAAFAGGSHGYPRQKHNAADMALARKIVVSPADLAVQGWKVQRLPPTILCSNGQNQSRLVETGFVGFDYSDSQAHNELKAAVWVFANTADATAYWREATSFKAVRGCWQAQLAGQKKQKTPVTYFSLKRLGLPSLGPRTAGHRVVLKWKNTPPVYEDGITLAESRAVADLEFLSPAPPPRKDELALVRLLSDRLSKT